MSVIAAALKHMLAANMPHEAILAAVEDMERGLQTDEQAERRRAADRDRQRARRLRISAESADIHDSPRESVTRVEDKTSNLDIEPQKKEQKDAPVRDVSEFKAEFADLDTERLNALIKHRRSKHGQITGHAARLFRDAAASCKVSISEAVDICIDRNWITLKPDWLNKPNGRSPPSQAPSMADVFEFAKHRQGDERQPEDFGGDGAVVPYLSLASQRRQ